MTGSAVHCCIQMTCMSVHIIKTYGATMGRFTDFTMGYLQLMTAICFPPGLGAELLQVATIGNVVTR